MFPPIEQLTADGYDLQFGTNVLGASSHPFLFQRSCATGPYYFTQLLLPTLVATAKTTSDGKARIVTTASSGHHFGCLDFDTFKDTPERRTRGSNTLYCQSKFVRPVHISPSEPFEPDKRRDMT